MEAILVLTTVAALYGAYLNSIGNWRGFAFWIVTNAIFMLNNWYIGQWQQALLFLCYMGIAANGLKNLKKD